MGDYWHSLGGKWARVPTGPVSLGTIPDPTSIFIYEDWGQGYDNGAIHNNGTNFVCCDGHAKWIKQGMKTIKASWW